MVLANWFCNCSILFHFTHIPRGVFSFSFFKWFLFLVKYSHMYKLGYVHVHGCVVVDSEVVVIIAHLFSSTVRIVLISSGIARRVSVS